MQLEDFQAKTEINDDVLAKFEVYHALLLKWQRAINLVSPKTLGDAWMRHFYDSAQLVRFIPAHVKTLVDLGSGAGFPGSVISILRPGLDVHLVESDQRKCEFLKTVSRETQANCTVHMARIETVVDDLAPDLVTARALAPLSDLLGYCAPWIERNTDLELLFLKGVHAQDEVEQARTRYHFHMESAPSVTDKNARIIGLRGISLLDVQL